MIQLDFLPQSRFRQWAGAQIVCGEALDEGAHIATAKIG
jgi:hypothetical protein